MLSTGQNKQLPIGYVLSLEGADSIITLQHLESAYEKGLRAIGPAHYGPGTYAPGTGESGPLGNGATELLREMERLNIILDVKEKKDSKSNKDFNIQHQFQHFEYDMIRAFDIKLFDTGSKESKFLKCFLT